MLTVEQLIGNLLLRHNCVIIPSFGGFVAKPVSARIDYQKGTMLPPGKSLLFNRQLINNDGLLVSEFAQSNQLSFDTALAEIDSKVTNWRGRLNLGERIEIDRVGNLFLDDERNLCFEQDRFFNLLMESFGLGSVHFLSEEDVQTIERKIERTSIQESKELRNEPILSSPEVVFEKVPGEEKQIAPIVPIQKATETTEESQSAVRTRKPWRYVAAACFLPIAFYSVWIPMKTDVLESGVLSFQDFNPFHKRTEGTYTPNDQTIKWVKTDGIRPSLEGEIQAVEGATDFYTFKFTEDTYIKVELPQKASEVVETPVIKEQQSNPGFEAHTMHYIVGCFGDKGNAENLVSKLRSSGLDARIVDVQNGLHRVSAGGALSMESYETIKLKADALGFSGWLLQ